MKYDLEEVFKIIDAWNYWCANRDYFFVEKVNWTCNTEHIKEKFDHFCETNGTYGSMITFYLDLDKENRKALVDYVVNNYSEFTKHKNDESSFVPKNKSSNVELLKDYLLKGYIARYDGYHNSIEIIPRDYVRAIGSSDNLFQHSGSLCSYYNSPEYKEISINIPSYALKDVINELKENYILNEVRCSGSGCCQYATYAIYLS